MAERLPDSDNVLLFYPNDWDGLASGNDDNASLDAAYQLLSPDEIEQIQQTAYEIVADIEAGDTDEIFVPYAAEALAEQMYEEEAPTLPQREHAQYYFLILARLTQQRYRQEETLPLPSELIEAYTAYSEIVGYENQNLPPHQRLPGFTVANLWAAARRYTAGAIVRMREPHSHRSVEEALFLLSSLEGRLGEAAQLTTF